MQRRKGRKVRNLPTTTPLEYGSSLRFGALNVEGMADTLKLKSSIQLMVEHKLDVFLKLSLHPIPPIYLSSIWSFCPVMLRIRTRE